MIAQNQAHISSTVLSARCCIRNRAGRLEQDPVVLVPFCTAHTRSTKSSPDHVLTQHRSAVSTFPSHPPPITPVKDQMRCDDASPGLTDLFSERVSLVHQTVTLHMSLIRKHRLCNEQFSCQPSSMTNVTVLASFGGLSGGQGAYGGWELVS